MSLTICFIGAVGVFFAVIGIIGAVAQCAHILFSGYTPELLRWGAKVSLGMIGIGVALVFLWLVLGPLRLA